MKKKRKQEKIIKSNNPTRKRLSREGIILKRVHKKDGYYIYARRKDNNKLISTRKSNKFDSYKNYSYRTSKKSTWESVKVDSKTGKFADDEKTTTRKLRQEAKTKRKTNITKQIICYGHGFSKKQKKFIYGRGISGVFVSTKQIDYRLEESYNRLHDFMTLETNDVSVIYIDRYEMVTIRGL